MTTSETRIGVGPEERLWRGPDIKAADTVIVRPHQTAPVPFIINPHNLPPIKLFNPQDPKNSRGLYPSVRSRYAQLGLDVVGKAIHRIADASTGRNGHESFTTEIYIENHGAKAVRIPESAKVFRLYSYSKDQIAKGSELRDLVDRADIKIEGSEGTAWEWDIDDEGNPIGVYVSIKPNSIRWIPPDTNGMPIEVGDAIHDYRQVIDTLLQPVRSDDKPDFWIAETPKIILGPLVDAILDRKVVIFGEGGLPVATKLIQINSRLIDGGKTDWSVRLEILGQLSVGELLYVRFSFVQR